MWYRRKIHGMRGVWGRIMMENKLHKRHKRVVTLEMMMIIMKQLGVATSLMDDRFKIWHLSRYRCDTSLNLKFKP